MSWCSSLRYSTMRMRRQWVLDKETWHSLVKSINLWKSQNAQEGWELSKSEVWTCSGVGGPSRRRKRGWHTMDFLKEEIPQRHRSMGKLSKTRKKWFLCQVNYGSEIKRYRNNIWPTACLMWLLTRKGKCFNHIKKTIREKWRMNGVHKCWNQIFFF